MFPKRGAVYTKKRVNPIKSVNENIFKENFVARGGDLHGQARHTGLAVVRERILQRERIAQRADALMADAGAAVRRQLFVVADNAERFHALALCKVFGQHHILDVGLRLLKCDRVLWLGGRAAGYLFHTGGNRCAELFLEQVAVFLQAADITCIEQAVAVRRDVEVKTRVRANRRQVCAEQPLEGMGFLVFVPEPAGADRHIDFRRDKRQPAAVKNLAERADFLFGVVQNDRSP